MRSPALLTPTLVCRHHSDIWSGLLTSVQLTQLTHTPPLVIGKLPKNAQCKQDTKQAISRDNHDQLHAPREMQTQIPKLGAWTPLPSLPQNHSPSNHINTQESEPKGHIATRPTHGDRLSCPCGQWQHRLADSSPASWPREPPWSARSRWECRVAQKHRRRKDCRRR